MTLQEERTYWEYLKMKLAYRLHDKSTASGFKQVLRRIGLINAEIEKIDKSLKVHR